MLACVVTTIGAFIGDANGSEAVTLATVCRRLALTSWCCWPCRAIGRDSTPYAEDTLPKRIAGRTYEQAAVESS